MTIKERKSVMNATIRLMKKRSDNFHMNWICMTDGYSNARTAREAINACGTCACLAGFVCATDASMPRDSASEYSAESKLGLDSDLSQALFFADSTTCPEFNKKCPEGHSLFNRAIGIGIAALRLAVKIQNARDKKYESL